MGSGAKPVSAELARVKMERHPKKNGALCVGIIVKYSWIEQRKGLLARHTTMRRLNVSVSSYFEHQRRKVTDPPETSGKHLSDAVLLVYQSSAYCPR